MKTRLSGIQAWAEEDRPREKLLLKGKANLTDAELLAILFNTGTRNKTAIDLAREILSEANQDLNRLARFTVQEFKSVGGIGEAKAITIIAALELGRRREKTEIKDKKVISSSKEVFDFFKPVLGELPFEEFWILVLNRANKVLVARKISEGGVAGTVADPKRIFKQVLDDGGCQFIAVHNHPSGVTKPSEADIRLTKKLSEGGLLLDISLLDHVIIAETGYFSFADEGILS